MTSNFTLRRKASISFFAMARSSGEVISLKLLIPCDTFGPTIDMTCWGFRRPAGQETRGGGSSRGLLRNERSDYHARRRCKAASTALSGLFSGAARRETQR